MPDASVIGHGTMISPRAFGAIRCAIAPYAGFHKWKVMAERKFDVRQGKLVTLLRCERCGKEQTKLL